ncbi:Malonyl CoA-acyl carrier protein transacylase [Candidatus Providencia siddallii]|uniref:Malonyl CoA-acyl carrier protein transacylase n=1 Tax=Candidatus Providencia siddallii TaxID=1715285 RepID=A0A0M6W6M0_9GAMM|nr:Malonyl CoA-acyl carrier protein transacylase [Candidatus Providencia siddallii]
MTKIAMVFPGQGSQSLGMLSALAKEMYIIKETFNEASEVLGYNLWLLIQNGTEKELNKTSKTQPALLTSSIAIFRAWKKHNGKMPIVMAGHSLGEYSALVCSDALEFKKAIKLVELRGELMQLSTPNQGGAMYAIIGLDHKMIKNVCKNSSQGQIVSIANFNSPNQTVIAGEKNAAKRAADECKRSGAKFVLLLSVNVPSHCILMKPAAKKLAKILDNIDFFEPKYPVINNVDVKMETSAKNIRYALVRQLYNPVRWTETIKLIAEQGVECILEIGPGKVLSNLTKLIACNLTAISINDPVSLKIVF